ncbi:MAG TPA: aldehyde dehydrogenase family protein [Blastocatellia bacterium]|nr:aldehyde dehydrogenase family protein [Blastocatellia bacterium]
MLKLGRMVHDDIINPFTGERVGQVPRGGAAEIDAALDAAVRAFASTRTLSAFRRRALLRAIADGLRSRADEFAELITAEAGKPITFARAEVGRAIGTFTFAAEELSRFGGEIVPVDTEETGEGYQAIVRRFPLGPIAAISPFNFPLNLVAHKLAPALAVGSAVVLKPAPQAPLTAFLLAEVVEAAGALPGQFTVVHCNPPEAEALATDPRPQMLSFTGSAAVGWHLRDIAGQKRVTLELGGNAGAIVHEDADLDWAVRRCTAGAFAYAGQVCISLQRLYVHDAVYADVRDALVAAARAVPVGDPRDPATVVGPVIDDHAADRIVRWIDEAAANGARVLTGGSREGRLVAPTIVEGVSDDQTISCEEVFGPVMLLGRYSDFDEAVRRVNASKYGLQAGVFTHDDRRIRHAFAELDVGGVIVNDSPMVRMDNYPYGGVKASGSGREGVRYAMVEMTEPRVLVTRT